MATACLDHRSRVRVNLRLRGHAYHLGGCRRISSLRHLVAELQNKSSPSNRRGTGKAERIIARTSIARKSRRGCRGEGTYEARHRCFCSSSSCFPQTDLRKHRWPPQVGADEKLDWRNQALSQLCAFCSPDRRKESANEMEMQSYVDREACPMRLIVANQAGAPWSWYLV